MGVSEREREREEQGTARGEYISKDVWSNVHRETLSQAAEARAKERETHRERKTQRERHTQRERETETDRETEAQTEIIYEICNSLNVCKALWLAKLCRRDTNVFQSAVRLKHGSDVSFSAGECQILDKQGALI